MIISVPNYTIKAVFIAFCGILGAVEILSPHKFNTCVSRMCCSHKLQLKKPYK